MADHDVNDDQTSGRRREAQVRALLLAQRQALTGRICSCTCSCTVRCVAVHAPRKICQNMQVSTTDPASTQNALPGRKPAGRDTAACVSWRKVYKQLESKAAKLSGTHIVPPDVPNASALEALQVQRELAPACLYAGNLHCTLRQTLSSMLHARLHTYTSLHTYIDICAQSLSILQADLDAELETEKKELFVEVRDIRAEVASLQSQLQEAQKPGQDLAPLQVRSHFLHRCTLSVHVDQTLADQIACGIGAPGASKTEVSAILSRPADCPGQA